VNPNCSGYNTIVAQWWQSLDFFQTPPVALICIPGARQCPSKTGLPRTPASALPGSIILPLLCSIIHSACPVHVRLTLQKRVSVSPNVSRVSSCCVQIVPGNSHSRSGKSDTH
jgi:hypothetical protein